MYCMRAAWLAALGFAVFAASDAAVKLLSEALPVVQIAFMVTGFALLAVVGATLALSHADRLRPRQPGLAFGRGLLLAVDTLLIYYAFANLDLAEAYVLAFLTPALVAILAVAFLHERLSASGWLGVGLGFAGVILALRPGVQALGLGHMAALASALVFAVTILLLRRIRVAETDAAPVAVLLVMLNLLALALTLAGGGFAPVDLRQVLLAALAGLLMALGHWLLIRAGRAGAAAMVAPFQYTQIIWAGFWGLVLFGTPVSVPVAAGAAVIILSGWLVLRPGAVVHAPRAAARPVPPPPRSVP